MKIVVLAGGLSPERDVSLCSGSLIANALIENGHGIAFVDLYKGTDDFSFYDKQGGRIFSYKVPSKEPDLGALVREHGGAGSEIGKNVIEICKKADVVFFALHGGAGENGRLSATFDMYGIKYTGTGYDGSLLAMDKDVAKRLMAASGINTPDWVLFDAENGSLDEAARKIGAPCVVKPCGCGSSVGVSMIKSRDEMDAAIVFAKKYERFMIIERLIEGREFSVGVMGGEALPVIEIIPKTGFYNYENKYQSGLTLEVCPADLPADIAKSMQKAAIDAHRALRLGFYSRVDFLLDKNNRHYCLEANTLPGMTPTSLLPQEAAAAGISYNELCEKIVMSAFGK